MLSAYFELILLILTVASGIIALIDIFGFAKTRKMALAAHPKAKLLTKKERKLAVKGPFLADYARALFPVFLVVLLLRSFVAEPFRIPSGSMQPTLKIGDFILVTRYDYGLRFPVWGWAITRQSVPKRGDVIVLHYPVNPKIDFIKRVIGLPGDTISYVNKQLIINGKKQPQQFMGNAFDPSDSMSEPVKQYTENLWGVKHIIYLMPWRPVHNFYHLHVPKGELFVMGDNRDNSDDARYWGFVPVKNVVGKAKFVLLSWNGANGSLRWNRSGMTIA